MTHMTALERCMTVLNGGIPDRVPVCLQNFMHAAAVAGMSLKEYCPNGEKMAAAHLITWEKYRHDLIDLENGVTALAGAVGCEIEIYDDKSPPWVSKPALENLEQVDRLRPIDPERDGALPAMLQATRILAKELGDHVCLLAEADQGPFSLAAQIIGIEEFLLALVNPKKADLMHRLLQYTTEQVITYGRALIEAGAHLTMMGESLAGPDVCSPKVYRQFAFPYERQVVTTLRAEGKAIGLHICGNATRIIEPMVDTGAIFLQVDYKIDRALCKQAAQGKTTLIGTVDPSAVLAMGTPEDVRRAALIDLEELAAGGGFMLSPGCSLPYITPNENVSALVEVAHTHGLYAQ
ncbi:MAG: uroporphyrinogen decarboxylase family protein [Caldilineaceae bacterium]